MNQYLSAIVRRIADDGSIRVVPLLCNRNRGCGTVLKRAWCGREGVGGKGSSCDLVKSNLMVCSKAAAARIITKSAAAHEIWIKSGYICHVCTFRSQTVKSVSNLLRNLPCLVCKTTSKRYRYSRAGIYFRRTPSDECRCAVVNTNWSHWPLPYTNWPTFDNTDTDKFHGTHPLRLMWLIYEMYTHLLLLRIHVQNVVLLCCMWRWKPRTVRSER